MAKKLVINRENFCRYYIETGCASEAYRRAYPNSVRWKDGVVKKRASELLKQDDVSSRLRELQAEAREEFKMRKNDALIFLNSIIEIDPIDLQVAGENGFVIRSLEDIPKSVRCCIQSIENSQYGVKIRLYSKIAALAQISKMLGWDAPVKSDVKTNVRMIIGDE